MLPYRDRERVRVQEPRKLHVGLSLYLHMWLRAWQPWRFCYRTLKRRSQAIVQGARRLDSASVEDIRARCSGKPRPGRAHAIHPSEIDQQLSAICALAERTLGLRPYPEQVHCALLIALGGMAEMATGEGKSLAAALAAMLLALQGRPVHVLTANDYLAQRDADIFQPLFASGGLGVACVHSDMPSQARPVAYGQAIVYTTSRELLGDYLRDRLKLKRHGSDLDRAIKHLMLSPRQGDELLLRGLHAVIVDEADSVLIDDAVMPLILSVPRGNPLLLEATLGAHALADDFVRGRDYRVLAGARKILWKSAGEARVARVQARLPRIWQGFGRARELMTLALMARELFHHDEHYIVQEDKLVLVDSQTGRLTPQRNLGIGLHQALEAKEGLPLSEPSETIARLSFQRFFRLIPHLGGMSGTVREASRELWRIYHQPVLEIPLHRPLRRQREPWLFFRAAEDKYRYLIECVCRLHAHGQPLLLGTRTVAISRLVAERLTAAGIAFQLLNAVQHREEAQVVAQAGRRGAVTIATNMAGRGTDIALTVDARALGGLYVIAVEPQRSARLDRQLHGRAGRQGDPGVETTLVSLDDEVLVAMLPGWLRRLFALGLPKRSGRPSWLGERLVRLAQHRAEQRASRQRDAILKSDDWLDHSLAFHEVSD
ncbi:preprotein translocase subunit SecA [Thiorhodovibrio winogradskyi]|uniref:Preprotein translocase subunit SecA n=1 Tax=Thiorhodovibrio winogradskyi TaxID=77007 RepID=A0ABZ0SEU1_9GAMM|nr:hypothetical protein [Thiorhodovibrio winogradskyi]